MRASPAFQVSLRRFGIWRALVFSVATAAVLAVAAWLLSANQAASLPMRGLAVTGALALWGCAGTLCRNPALSLRWDTQMWHLGPLATRGDEPWHGRVTIAVDLGAWMLLAFERDSVGGMRRRTVWVPVQRSGLEGQWHALRCAVYCARPAEGHAAGPSTAISPKSQE